MTKIFEQAYDYFQQQLPFVLYCKPESSEMKGFFQNNKELHLTTEFSEKGFVFSNFVGSQSVLFPENECTILNEKWVSDADYDFALKNEVNADGKIAFEHLVQLAIDAINESKFQKVVLSRKETLTMNDFSFLEVFQKLRSTYPSAFRYCWFHPEIGMWMGATPEQLLKTESGTFGTVALAGTQKWEGDAEIIWHAKERQEQQFVTDFIVSGLKSEVESINKSEPYTFQAGKIVHLKTDINGVFASDFDVQKVLSILHPTPAICGLPRNSSRAFILENEGYDRKFYAGFLGEIHRDQAGDLDLYVNLRCMEITDNRIHLYIGCGITKDSNPEKEYIETANKALTMKQILN
jgi:isochorismate synthase